MRALFVTLLLLVAINLRAQPVPPAPADEGRSIFTFTPLGFMVAYEEFNPCLAIGYEYILNPERGIGLALPLVYGYAGPEQGGFLGSAYNHTAFYAAPGVRFHAALGGGHKKKEFITGPSVLAGNMHLRAATATTISSGPYVTVYQPSFNYALTGLAADNTLNFYNRHFVFGFDACVGYLFEEHDRSRFFIHLGMHFGGKF